MVDQSMIEGYTRQIEQKYPDLKLHSARLLTGYGQFSDVLIVNENSASQLDTQPLVFRFPRTPAVAVDMAHEVILLRQLQNKLPLPIPDPIYTLYDGQTGKLILMGYPMLPGEPLQRETMAAIVEDADEAVLNRLASQLAGFLKTLHAMPLNSLRKLRPPSETRESWQQMYGAFRNQLYPFMRVDAQREVSANFERFLSDDTHFSFSPVLRHGDYGTGNLLIDMDTLNISGVIDFSFAGPGDAAQDPGALSSFGDAFMERCFVVYPEMRDMLKRVEFIRSTYALQQALYALRDHNQDDFEDGIAAYV
jgi:aminoglycoside 2''-phosphotransferase